MSNGGVPHEVQFISVGGNRHPGAADWDSESGLLAFGADNNIALWNPLVCWAKNPCSYFLQNKFVVVISKMGSGTNKSLGPMF